MATSPASSRRQGRSSSSTRTRIPIRRRRRCSAPSAARSSSDCKSIQIRWPTPFAAAPRNCLGVEPNWILCGNGSDDILTIVTRAFVGQGDCLRLPYPSYILYKTLAQLQGAEAEEIHFQKDWSLGDDFAKPRDRLKLAYLPNPNSPSGTMLSAGRVQGIGRHAPLPFDRRRSLRRFRRLRIASRW